MNDIYVDVVLPPFKACDKDGGGFANASAELCVRWFIKNTKMPVFPLLSYSTTAPLKFKLTFFLSRARSLKK